ncbi:F0F1 ATP synthase subunit B [Desulfovermiculus halophilus]|jgi:F-type H+-transporting ATPase subunit b|uniref:F0F1 ATP synthase subunit B n=1 Tax=Desulfovermiculus halophilus TaxID=339722 RepID=UPI000487FD1C|nr:F0F1 ATP synthase subunit B [Desulfovermiculus halophilus]
MIELNITLFIQLVNFLILLALLNFLIYKPIRGIVKQRQEKMSSDLSGIEEFNAQARSKLDEYQAALDRARREAGEIRESSKKEAVAEEKDILAAAGEEGNKILTAARDDIQAQSQEARKALDQKVKKYAKQVTDKVLVKA